MSTPEGIPRGPVEVEPVHAIGVRDGYDITVANRDALLAALDGLELGAYDRRIAGWLTVWEPPVVATVCSWLYRAREMPPNGASSAVPAAEDDSHPLDQVENR